MRYSDGREIHLGDVVSLEGGHDGIVVCSLDTDEYSSEYQEADWSYLKKGVLVQASGLGVMHFEAEDPDLRFVARRADSPD